MTAYLTSVVGSEDILYGSAAGTGCSSVSLACSCLPRVVLDVLDLCSSPHRRLRGTAVVGHTRAAADFHRAFREGIVGRLARPDEGLARAQVRHLFWRQRAERGVRLLNVLEPRRRVELVKNDLA